MGWELPGGLIDEGEEPAETAARELEEETGYRAARVEHLITFQPMVGMVDSEHVVFTGRDPEKVGEPTEMTEVERMEWVPLGSVPGLIAAGEIWEFRDAGRVAANIDAAGLGGLGDPSGQVADAAALAGGAGELGEFSCLLEVVSGFVVLAADVQGGGQIAAQACFGAGEAVVHRGQGSGQVIGGLRVAESDQAVAAPAGQVRLVQGQIGQVLAGGTVADLLGGTVEGVAAGRLLPAAPAISASAARSQLRTWCGTAARVSS